MVFQTLASVLTRVGGLLGKSSARQVFAIAALRPLMDAVFPKPVSVFVCSEKRNIVQIIFFDSLTGRGVKLVSI